MAASETSFVISNSISREHINEMHCLIARLALLLSPAERHFLYYLINLLCWNSFDISSTLIIWVKGAEEAGKLPVQKGIAGFP